MLSTKPSKLNDQIFGEWCPGADLNHRHEDFQAPSKSEKTVGYADQPRQTPHETPNTYAQSVKPIDSGLAKENAASAGTDHGVKTYKTTLENDTANPAVEAISKHLNSDDQSVFRMLAYTLTLDSEADWWNFSAVLAVRWSQRKIATLAYFALKALPHDIAYDTAHAACFGYVRAE